MLSIVVITSRSHKEAVKEAVNLENRMTRIEGKLENLLTKMQSCRVCGIDQGK